MTTTPASQAVRASEWPAPAPVRLRGLGLGVGVLVCLHAVAALVAAGAMAWRLGDPPAWLTGEATSGLVGAAAVSLLVAALAWVVWQHRAVRAFPPGTPRSSPGWHLWSWLIPVGAWWLPYRNLGDLFRCAGRRRPRWMLGWWVLWVVGLPLSVAGWSVALDQPSAAAWLMGAGCLLLAGAAAGACALVSGLSRSIESRLSSGRPTGR